jgi:hypothetical protein
VPGTYAAQGTEHTLGHKGKGNEDEAREQCAIGAGDKTEHDEQEANKEREVNKDGKERPSPFGLAKQSEVS